MFVVPTSGKVLVYPHLSCVMRALPPGEGTGEAGAEALAIHIVLQGLEYKWEQP